MIVKSDRDILGASLLDYVNITPSAKSQSAVFSLLEKFGFRAPSGGGAAVGPSPWLIAGLVGGAVLLVVLIGGSKRREGVAAK